VARARDLRTIEFVPRIIGVLKLAVLALGLLLVLGTIDTYAPEWLYWAVFATFCVAAFALLGVDVRRWRHRKRSPV
jgi:uncharacterized membrane protein